MKIGSPEWFNQKSKEKQHIDFQQLMEQRREQFCQKYSPENLSSMDGGKLLSQVFNKNGMIGQLMSKDGDYRNFGTTGKFWYLSIVYQTKDGAWRYRGSDGTIEISKNDAPKYAVKVRDEFLSCLNIIKENEPYNCEDDYVRLEQCLSKCYFSDYVWILKYYQMFFPQYFPGMYGDGTLERAMGILGLSKTTKRLVNAGIISLFIRKCNINNIVFNNIYEEKWGWDDKQPPCEGYSTNAALSLSFESGEDINLSFYHLPNNDSIKEMVTKETKETDDLLNALDTIGDDIGLIGYDRAIITKARVNHGVFRDRLLSTRGKCELCGVASPSLLIASHIKPWASSSPEEKIDFNNGLLLCPNHDKLFDQGFISFDANGNIIISEKLSKTDRLFMNVQESMKISVSEKNCDYFAFHRLNVFQDNQ